MSSTFALGIQEFGMISSALVNYGSYFSITSLLYHYVSPHRSVSCPGPKYPAYMCAPSSSQSYATGTRSHSTFDRREARLVWYHQSNGFLLLLEYGRSKRLKNKQSTANIRRRHSVHMRDCEARVKCGYTKQNAD